MSCWKCKFCECDEDYFPCSECYAVGKGETNHFTPIENENMIENSVRQGQLKEEINHPDRYKSGKFECIDVMLDVFGKEAVMHFCLLNAFKYIWRAEKKGGIQDVEKAVWYLNKYIELGREVNDRA